MACGVNWRPRPQRSIRIAVSCNAPIFKSAELEDSVAESLSRLTERRVVRHPRIRNVKGEIAHLPDRYYFEFDIGFEGRPDIAIEVIQAGKYGRAKSFDLL